MIKRIIGLLFAAAVVAVIVFAVSHRGEYRSALCVAVDTEMPRPEMDVVGTAAEAEMPRDSSLCR